ncbi:diguanylate cyclase [Aestuariibacter halophilus]|uniref:diguanylate cyclase n=1 Tax=Fluctibacter halophilus TaxID=226011 RepID=A0ABS8G5H3_9ALTE|nr:diguanylate cyclase [Aestuariibacter halophilus]
MRTPLTALLVLASAPFLVVPSWVFAQNAVQETTLQYCIDPDWLPYEGLQNGRHVGISADYLALLRDKTGIQFSLLPTDSWQHTLRLLQQGQCDATLFANMTPDRRKYLVFTDPIFSATNVFVTRQQQGFIAGYSDIHDLLLGVVDGYRHAEIVARHYPDIRLRELASETEGLQLLNAGEIDVMVGSMLSVSSQIQRFGFRNLQISGLAPPHDALRMALITKHAGLLTALNAAIADIDEDKHAEIFKQWHNARVVDQWDYRFVWPLLGGFVALLVLIAWRNHHVSRYNRLLESKNRMLEELQDELLEKNETLAFLSTHDPLTDLYNRHYLLQRCEQEIVRLQRFTDMQASLILFDVDLFKAVNDAHGHSVGDAVLQHVAETVREAIREIDTLGRWGGEEFLILCPQSDLASANILAERLRERLERSDMPQGIQPTCSFGVAQYHHNEGFIAWFDRADAAMYQAKMAGRNCVKVAD